MAETVATHRPDYVLGLLTFILVIFGLVMIYSISPVLSYDQTGILGKNTYFYKQILVFGIGIVAWVIAQAMDYRRWRRLAWPFLAGSLLVMLVILIPAVGRSSNGATRWLDLGPVTIQPAEFLKLSLVLFLAAWLDKRRDQLRTFSAGFWPLMLILGVLSVLVVILERDLGTMIVIAGAAVCMYYVAGASYRQMASLVLVGGAALVGVIVAFPHRMQRIMDYLNPASDPATSYHITQALIAIGSGGWFGLGLGKSLQIHGYLPEAANDSIFAIVAEELGLIGSILVVALFVALAYRGYRIARDSRDNFARLVATGITTWLILQALINICAMLGLIPLTGIPLPFISFGGSSLIVSLAGVGILQSISKHTQGEYANARIGLGWRDSGAHFALTRSRRRVKAN